MYPAPFEYYRAETAQEATELLSKHTGAKILAGGHSLVPAMKYRVAAPSALVDIGRLSLNYITAADSVLTIGALSTHATVASSDVVKHNCAIIAQGAAGIGDQMVRNRGTIGGSLAHSDPQADYPTLVKCVGATIKTSSGKSYNADTFFKDMLTTALEENDIITEITMPVYGSGTGGYYYKIPHPASGYAVAGAAALVTVEAGICKRVSLVVGGATVNPVHAVEAEAYLVGKAPTSENIKAAAAMVAQVIKNPMGDGYASGAYRTHLAGVASERALVEAVHRAA